MSPKSIPKTCPDHIGHRGRMKNPDNHFSYFTIIDEICRPLRYYPKKLIYLQRILFDKNQRKELRLCYYIVGKTGLAKGKWVFGQFATLLRKEDFRAIIKEAEKRGWI